MYILYNVPTRLVIVYLNLIYLDVLFFNNVIVIYNNFGIVRNVPTFNTKSRMPTIKSKTSLLGPESMSEIYYSNMLLNHLWTADNFNITN